MRKASWERKVGVNLKTFSLCSFFVTPWDDETKKNLQAEKQKIHFQNVRKFNFIPTRDDDDHGRCWMTAMWKAPPQSSSQFNTLCCCWCWGLESHPIKAKWHSFKISTAKYRRKYNIQQASLSPTTIMRVLFHSSEMMQSEFLQNFLINWNLLELREWKTANDSDGEPAEMARR